MSSPSLPGKRSQARTAGSCTDSAFQQLDSQRRTRYRARFLRLYPGVAAVHRTLSIFSPVVHRARFSGHAPSPGYTPKPLPPVPVPVPASLTVHRARSPQPRTIHRARCRPRTEPRFYPKPSQPLPGPRLRSRPVTDPGSVLRRPDRDAPSISLSRAVSISLAPERPRDGDSPSRAPSSKARALIPAVGRRFPGFFRNAGAARPPWPRWPGEREEGDEPPSCSG